LIFLYFRPENFLKQNFTVYAKERKRKKPRSAKNEISTMASVDKELEEELLEAGNKLLDPPSNVKDLLDILIVSILCFIFCFLFF
jgi:hypothetical protein